jgi:hypothetical protein
MMRFSRFTGRVLPFLGMRRATTDWLPRTFIGFSAGLITGAAAALILAPKTGVQVRGDLRVGAEKLVKKGREQFAELKDRALHYAGSKTREPERPPLGV